MTRFNSPEINHLYEKRLTGIRMRMSFNAYNSGELWKTFMPRRSEIKNRLSNELISLAVYPEFYFSGNIDPQIEFEKWALAEIADFDDVPPGMETFILQEGLYAVFRYKGLSTDNSIYRWIFSEWLPTSGFEIDNRPHFEILGEKYRNGDPESEEEIWIPLVQKP